MEDSLDEKLFSKKLRIGKISDILNNNCGSNEIINTKQNLQKFNVERFEEKNKNNNCVKLCDKCNLAINSFTLNDKIIKLLFNQPIQLYSQNNNNSSFINELLINKNICSNCLKMALEEFYFKKKDTLNGNNLEEKDKEIMKIFQVFENMDEEKLNINIRLYHIYKKLINSYAEYIKDNNNNRNDNNYYNIKNHKIIGIDCILNIIDLLNKNISIIKEKNSIKKQFFEEVIKESDSLIKNIKNNYINFQIPNEALKDNIDENLENNNNNFQIPNEALKHNVHENLENYIINSSNKNSSQNLKSEKRSAIIQKNDNIRLRNNQNLFKTKIIKSKKKSKRLKRILKKIRFTINIK